jgi:hypothetical protein
MQDVYKIIRGRKMERAPLWDPNMRITSCAFATSLSTAGRPSSCLAFKR